MTETTIIETNSAEETISAAEQFAKLLKAGDTVLYTGEMGAGKTQFTKGIAKHFGCTDPVTSPTFAIVNEYRAASGDSIFHFDFYRIEKPSEALDIGFYDYIDSGCLCFMEWPSEE